ncbi:hypothetical protein DES53_104209 [Roseimicrobium gellanilyticum]|uniref:Carboxypeptidase family protein n=1 Tax=Roseimicrobium gellanilyticum TaxID=748857 RepID=A0A366HMM1_9BACT|nr:carboxypeptidase-like regulatory domain-containing protein [Roseimicrobium gellanilyticum]RBP44389.1 hypothetical protein DES53_104209 [Roseimicrobium gellanilyticum]
MKSPFPLVASFGLALVLLATLPSTATAQPAPDASRVQVTGTVVDEQGKPVARVRVQDLDGEAPAVVTDEAGKFVFLPAQPDFNHLVLSATEPEGTRSGYDRIYNHTVEPNLRECRIVLKPMHTLTVHVKGARDAAIKDAFVGVEHQYDFVSTGKTTSEGKAVLRIPADAKIRYVLALKAGEGFDYIENFLPGNKYKESESLPAEVTMRLNGARRVHIRAEDASGKPLPGMTFTPWTLKIFGKQHEINISGATPGLGMPRTTDDSGIATFDWLPVDSVGNTSFLLVDSNAYHQPRDPHLTFGEVEKTDTPILKTRLLRTVTLRGKVVKPDGTPAPGILIQAEGKGATNHYCREKTRSASDGTFQFILYPEQSYIIAVLDDDWAARSITGLFLKDGAAPEEITLSLCKGTFIHGMVTQGPGHTPVTEATVVVVQKGSSIEPPADPEQALYAEKEESLVRWTGTDGEGRYRIRVGPGVYEIDGEPRSGMRDVVVKDEPTLKVDLHSPK